MTLYELLDAFTEFVEMQTSDMRYMTSNEETPNLRIAPQVRSGFIPRNEAGDIIPGEEHTYPSIIITIREGEQRDLPGSHIDSGWNVEMVVVEALIGTFDANRDQQGYRDCMNIVQRLKERVRIQDFIRQRYAIRMPIRYLLNRKYVGQGGMNSFPYFFAEMYFTFAMEVGDTQYDATRMSPQDGSGIFDQYPIPSGPYVEHYVDKLQEVKNFVEGK